MRLLLGLASVAAVIGLAVPAHADPGSASDDDFLAAINQAGITFHDADQAVAAGKTVCELMDHGVSGLDVLHDLKVFNPGFTLDGTAKFAAIAARVYCPEHLEQDGSPRE